MAGSTSYDPRTWIDFAAFAVPDSSRQPSPPADRRQAYGLAASALILLGGGATAWLARQPVPSATVAVASPPGASAPAVAVAPSAVAAAAPSPADEVERTLVLASAADLRSALASSGVDAGDAAAAEAAAQPLLKTMGEVRAVLTLGGSGPAQRLRQLQLSNPDGSGVRLVAAGNGRFTASSLAAQLTRRVVVRSGRMDADSFYSSAVAAGITDSLIPVFAKALAFDFDFQREVAAGDAFEAAFAQDYNAQGKPVGAPVLLYASLTTATKSATVYRFDAPGEPGEWYDGSGRSVVRSLMRTPIDGARVSSTFGMRVHPVLGYQKMHKGTDFAAPIGTPIFASGNAVVQWSGMKGPNGNLVVLRHDNGWETFYLHQSMIMPNVTVGARVTQGQKIGEVGTTGRSTGPHLHYEVHIDGQPVDSMTIKVDEGRTLSGPALVAFGKVRDAIDLSRATPAS